MKEGTYTIGWRVEFEIDAPNEHAAKERVRRIVRKLYATSPLSQDSCLDCES